MKRTKKTSEDHQFIERKITVGMITHTEYLDEIMKICNPVDFLASATAKTIANWVVEYHRKYGEAPKKNIQGIYFDKLKSGLGKDQGEDIEGILNGLSEEYTEKGVDPFLLDKTIRYFQIRQAEKYQDRQNEALAEADLDTFYNLHTTFKPIQRHSQDEKYNAWELYDMKIEPIQWLIEGFLPHGLTIFGGQSKTGKSYLMLHMMMKLSQGKYMFDDSSDVGFRGERGHILYLALEDNKTRLQNRLHAIEKKPKQNPLKRYLEVRFSWPMLHKGGIHEIEQWLKSKRTPKLVVIDVIAKVWSKSARTSGGGLYAEEYAIYSPLADLAHRYGISIIVITHTKKSKEHDVFNEILGGAGTQGPADNLMVLSRHPTEPDNRILSIRGKDIEEQKLLFTVSEAGANWYCEGEVHDLQKTSQRQEIYNLLEGHPEGMTVEEIKDQARQGYIQVSEHSVNHLLGKMVRDGVLEKLRYGVYGVSGNRDLMINSEIGKNLNKD